jgi:membrane protein implicated in regulation of membrane protease activity
MHEEHGLSIWFFVGVMLSIYGIIILIANIPAFSTVATAHVVLEELHAGLWWSILLILLGALFLFLHWPGKHTTLDDKDHRILSEEADEEN